MFFGQKIWSSYRAVEDQIKLWISLSIKDAWHQWASYPSSHTFKAFPLIIYWGIWIACNRSIFRDEASSPRSIIVELMTILSHFPHDKDAHRVILNLEIFISKLYGLILMGS